MLKLLQRVKVRKVKKVTGELAREEDGGEDLQGEVGGRGSEVEAEKREWKFAEKEGDGKADMIQVKIKTDKMRMAALKVIEQRLVLELTRAR